MPGVTPLIEALCKAHCTLEDVKLLLEKDASYISEVDDKGEGPLHYVLRYSTCPIDIVSLLLDCGADVNLVNRNGWFPLLVALQFGVKADIIKLLLDRGAKMNKVKGRSLLRYALNNTAVADVIKHLLNAGLDVNEYNGCYSNLEYAFHASHKADVIKLLLDAGAVVKRVDTFGNPPLHSCLRLSKYETTAMKLLMDHPGIDINIRDKYNSSVLHEAVQNRFCKLSVLRALIKRGARVDAVDNLDFIPLHMAVTIGKFCQPEIIKILLQNGSSVNKRNKYGGTVLGMAVRSHCSLEVLKLLLTAGARIIDTRDQFGIPICILQWGLNRYILNQCKENMEYLQMFLKYIFIEHPNFIWNHRNRIELSHFAKECVVELQNMKLENVGNNFTLHEFVCEIQMDMAGRKQEVRDYDFNKLLSILVGDTFPIYFDVISSKVERVTMETKLKEQLIYPVIGNPALPCSKNKVILDYPSVFSVTQFLSNNALLRLIVALHNSDNSTATVNRLYIREVNNLQNC